MLNCREVEPLLAVYADGAAAPRQRAAVDEHVAACLACRQLLAAQQAARTVIAACRDTLRGCASEHLRARCAAHRAASGIRRGLWPIAPGALRAKWVPLSLAATLVLALGGAFIYGITNQVEAIAAQVALDHMKCFQVGSLSPVDPQAAATDWASTYGWPVQVPASAPGQQLEFLRLRRCFLTEGRAAHMMYRWRGQPLSVFVVPDALPEAGTRELVSTLRDHKAIVWSSGGRTYIVLARGRPSEIEPIVGYVRANAR